MVSNAILQGTISEVTGGKFANGAMSGAFRAAFNDVLGSYKDWDSWIDPNLKSKDNGESPYFLTNTFSDFNEGGKSFYEDYFRLKYHIDSLRGKYGLESQQYALNADMTIAKATNLYINNDDFRGQVNSLMYKQASNNKAFFSGRTSVSIAHSYLLGRVGFRFRTRIVGNSFAFTQISYGRALAFYDKGYDTVRIMSGALIGK
ncbi:MAG: hypothetical protein DWP95_05690 [Proteobacteria bacterium]|nr:MAG: hypothetical protein DWP95_05690 [Pseudomonadota bacterium]